MHASKSHPLWLFVLFPAIAMLLGWGLRGYIGGGPYGAMIPGVYVALCLVVLLGYTPEAAAIAALFGAIGVGYGGEMTYGHAIGFLQESDTLLWGLTACTLKGAAWGLFGGAVLGVGLTRYQYDRKTLTIGFIITVIAFYVGVKLINEPRLIYFARDPREECWAGMLFAPIALLVYLRRRGTAEHETIPLHFALWGMVGGAVGFGGGALWMAFGHAIPFGQRWAEWWKMMEFTFGFIFGGALGWCAYLHRDALQDAGQRVESPGESWAPLIGFVVFITAVLVTYPMLDSILPEGTRESSSIGAIALRDIVGTVLGFVFVGAVAIVLGIRSRHAAWQIAVTLTFFHTVLDFMRDLSTPKSMGYSVSGTVQLIIVIVTTLIVGVLVYRWQRGEKPILKLFLLAVWACYISACARSFFRKEFFFPPEGESMWSVLVQKHSELFLVHGTFTVSALLTTWFLIALTKERQGIEAP